MFLRLYPTNKYASRTLYWQQQTDMNRLFYLAIETSRFTNLANALRPATADSDQQTTTTSRKMTLSSKSLAGPGYIILNCIRVMNIIGFLAVIAASVVMLVKTSTASKFFFFDAVTHVLTAVTSSKCLFAYERLRQF